MDTILLEDKNKNDIALKVSVMEDFAKWWTCNISKVLWTFDDNNYTWLCKKEISQRIIDNILPELTVQHQMNVFKRLKENNISTYESIRINEKEQVMITPLISDDISTLCISWNNKSKSKDIIVKELWWLHYRDISNLGTFIDDAKESIEKISKAGIKVFDDSFFYKYNCNGGILEVFIWQFHHIILEDTTIDETKFRSIKQHNKNQFEKSIRFLNDDGIIDKWIYDTFYCQLRDLNDY